MSETTGPATPTNPKGGSAPESPNPGNAGRSTLLGGGEAV